MAIERNKNTIIVRFSKSKRINGKATTASKCVHLPNNGQTNEELMLIHEELKAIVMKQLDEGTYQTDHLSIGIKQQIKDFNKLQNEVNGYAQYQIEGDYNYKGVRYYNVQAYSKNNRYLRCKLSQITEREVVKFIEQETEKLKLVEVE